MISIFMSGGERSAALEALLRSGQKITGVITPYLMQSNSRFRSVITMAIRYGVPVYPVRRDNISEILSQLQFDVLISCGFPYLLKRNVVDLARYAINVHPTLLPRYRGFRSGPYVLINGEKRTGVTIHMLTEQMDQGDIILQRSFAISSFDTTRSLYRKCREMEGDMLVETLKMLEKGDYKLRAQDEAEALEIKKVRMPEDSEIDWNRPLKELYNEIRACDSKDYPAFFRLNGEKVCIKLWRPQKPIDEEDMI